MKKVIFLFGVLLVIISNVNDVNGAIFKYYEFDSYTIETERFRSEEDERGYYIEKIGTDPFSMTLFYENAWVTISDIKEVNNYIFIIGMMHYHHADTFYDSYVLVLSMTGEEVFKDITDNGDLESTVDAYQLGDMMVVQSLEEIYDEQRPIFKNYLFTAYNNDFEVVNQTTVDEVIKKHTVEDDMYFYSHNYDDFYDGAINSNFDHILSTDHLSIPLDEVYIDSLYLPIINEAVLNNEIISNGHLVDYPGIYNLSYNNMNYSFIIEPSISGVEDGMIYNSEIIPKVSKGNLSLNGALFSSGEIIDQPGYYSLEITGINDFFKAINFTITSNIDGVLDRQTYQRPLEITFNGDGYLNNTYVESPLIIEDQGEYTLKIQGENNYLETFNFIIEEKPEESSTIDFIQKYDVVVLFVVGVSAIIILKKK